MSMQLATFRDLHVPGDPFILANVWELGSARMMASLGAKALATSSAAHAFTLGVPDMGHVTRQAAIAHATDIVNSSNLPVSGDLENGYGHSAQDVAQTIQLASQAGLSGCCIEDVELPASDVYAFSHAVERIEAAAAAAKTASPDFVLTARADGVMLGRYDLAEAVRRVQAFERVGADVAYVPMPQDMDALAQICRAVSIPVNALCAGPFAAFNRLEFAEIGVARISLGSSLARATHKVMHDAGRAMFELGDLSALSDSIDGTQVDALLKAGGKS